jgi:hypothetical protein
MEKETLKNILYFLEENDNKRKPFMWKLMNNEPFTKEDLKFNGDLDLSYTKIKSLPEGLVVNGNLNLTRSEIQSLSEGLEVKYILRLSYCENFTSLPEGLKVGVNLHLKGCKNLTSLPKGLKVDYHVDITDSGLEHYSDEDLFKMIDPNGDGEGYIKGRIIR